MSSKSLVRPISESKIIEGPRPSSLTWRLDVILASSSVSRVMQPSVILCIGLTDGSFRTIEVSISAFHELRYHIAEALHQYHKLEANYLFQLRV